MSQPVPRARETGRCRHASADVLDAIGDQHTLAMLRALSEQRLSATELVERVAVSTVTVYRRLNTLEEHGLIRKGVRFGEEYSPTTVYETAIERLDVRIRDGEIAVRVFGGESQ